MKATCTLFSTATLSLALLAAPATQAALVGSADGLSVYDTDSNLTWLANANLADTNTFGLATFVELGSIPGTFRTFSSIIYSDGAMTWGGALKWIAAMNSANYLGYNDWRLPTSDSCLGLNCTSSEMGHLFYNELGGVANASISTTHNANYSLFQNLQSGYYWSGTEFTPDTNYILYQSFYNGYQYINQKDGNFYAMAVRGQALSTPVPASAWLIGSGLLGLIGVARRKVS